MTIQSLQQRFPWIMKPFVWLDVVLTPRRWASGLDRLATSFSNAVIGDSTGLARSLSRMLQPVSRLRARAVADNNFLRNLDWGLRKSFWSLTWAFIVFGRLWPRKPPMPVDQKLIRLISAPESYSDFKSPLLVVPSDVPSAELTLQGAMTVQTLHLIQDIYPIVTSHQPAASTGSVERLRQAFPWIYRLVRDAPVWHPDLVQAANQGKLLDVLAVGGPFAKLVEKATDGSGMYHIDLRYLAAFPVREGLAPLGCRIRYTERQGTLRLSGIDYKDQSFAADAPNWGFIERIALCTLLTHTTVWRHGMQYHVAGLAPFAPISHNLPPAHPLRRLLAPHIADTLSTNYHTHLTLRRSGFDVTGFSFSYETILHYYNEGARTFELARLDPRMDLERKGIPPSLAFPYREQAIEYFNLVESYVRRYIDHYYAGDEVLQADKTVQIWLEALNQFVIGGVRGYVPQLTKVSLAKLCSLFIYSVTVEHEENSMWNYAVFLPATVHADGSPQTVGEVQSVMNFQLVISSAANKLMADFTYLALDNGAVEIMRDFQASLKRLQERTDRPDSYWRIRPSDLEASVSA